MNKKARDDLVVILRFLFLIGGFYFVHNYIDNTPIYLYLIVFFVALILPDIIIRTKKKKTKPKTTKKAATKKSNSGAINHNLLRSDNEIMKLSLDEISAREFERLCFLYYQAKGYKPQETPKGADGGVDLILFDKKDPVKIAVQIKYYKAGQNVSVKPIRELDGAKKNYKCLYATFITTSHFSKNAKIEAERLKIDTHDKTWVENKIIRWKENRLKQLTKSNQ